MAATVTYPRGSAERKVLVALQRGPLNFGAFKLIAGDSYATMVALSRVQGDGMVRKLRGPTRYELTDEGRAEIARRDW